MKFTYYGHSSFQVETVGKKLLFDPFITGNELAKHININDIEADYILITHGHGDHVGDAVGMAQSTDALVISSFEICNWLSAKGVKKYHPMNTGGVWNFEGFSVRCTVAQHSGGLPDGSYGGNPMGFIVTSKEGSFYYAGDTALTLDMQLIPQWAKLNFAVLPLGDNFTMGYQDAALASKLIGCTEIIGVHYDTFGYIRIDHQAAIQAFKKAGANLHLVRIGESITI